MRVYIMTDLEGVAGVLDSENWCLEKSRNLGRARELLTCEVNAAIEGFVSAGATEILVADGHGWGGIERTLLHPAAELASKWPKGREYPFSLDSRPFDVAAWIGQHPKAGTVLGHLCHTGSMYCRNLTLNGMSIGEFGEMAFCAAELGVRPILAAGCEAFAREASVLVPGIETVAVKRGTQTDPGDSLGADEYRRHNSDAVHLAPEDARKLIRDAARRALVRAGDPDFGRLELPKPPYEAVLFTRPDAQGVARILRKSHASSIIELLNLPWI